MSVHHNKKLLVNLNVCIQKILILAFSIMFSASCNQTASLQQDINQTITLSAPPQVNSFQANDFVGLVIQNNSKDNILLSVDYGVHVLVLALNENNWNEVSILNPYTSPTMLSPKSETGLDFAFIDIVFKSQIKDPTDFRFMVMGINQATNKEVYAYIDLTLSP